MDETDAGRGTVGRIFAAFFPATGCIENDWAVFVCMCFFLSTMFPFILYMAAVRSAPSLL